MRHWLVLGLLLGACTGAELEQHGSDAAAEDASDTASDAADTATDAADTAVDSPDDTADTVADNGGDPTADTGADPTDEAEDVATEPSPCEGHCGNGRRDCGEQAVDCGGDCTACDDPCAGHCTDDLQDCGEEGVDCGAECDACTTSCLDHCDNDVRDCGEEATDCGGECDACTAPCDNHCENDSVDCGETGPDCGGECPACGTIDNASVVGHALPSALACNASVSATVTLQNTGSTTWYRDGGYKLGYVGDLSNPFLPPPPGNSPRVLLGSAQVVEPGQQVTFTVPLHAPASEGTYTAAFQMVLESVHWFGAVASAPVNVTCGAGGSCSFPQGVPEGAFHAGTGNDATIAQAVNEVMEDLSGCSAGSDCYIGDAYTDQSWFAAVNNELRLLGLCAGQHEAGYTDEIAVSNTGCTGNWYGYHIFNYGGSKVVWNPGAQRGYWTIDAEYCP